MNGKDMLYYFVVGIVLGIAGTSVTQQPVKFVLLALVLDLLYAYK